MNSIFTRRSVRKYLDKEIPEEIIKKLIEAGMCAPSAGNERPWHFILVKNKDLLLEISNMSPYSKMTANANIAIIVCCDLTLEKFKGFWVQDCSAATENILLEIENNGLGGVWLGVYPIEERINYIKNLFKLPDNIIPFSVIPVGYPAEKLPIIDRFDNSRLHIDKW